MDKNIDISSLKLNLKSEAHSLSQCKEKHNTARIISIFYHEVGTSKRNIKWNTKRHAKN